MRDLTELEVEAVNGGLTPEEINNLLHGIGDRPNPLAPPFDPTHPWIDWGN